MIIKKVFLKNINSIYFISMRGYGNYIMDKLAYKYQKLVKDKNIYEFIRNNRSSFCSELYSKMIRDRKYDRRYFSDEFISLMILLKEPDMIKILIEHPYYESESCKKGTNDLIKLIQNF